MTDISPGSAIGTGTDVSLGLGATPFINLRLASQLVTDATQSPWAAPNALTVPTTDTLVKVHDASSRRFIWHYQVTGAVATGTEMTT